MRANNHSRKQAGVALFICLMLLLILSLLGITALRMVTSQNLISSSSQGSDIAFDAAETGINMAIMQTMDGTLDVPAQGVFLPITTAYPKDNRNIASINVSVRRPDPTVDLAAGKRALEARVRFGALPNFEFEQFYYESTGAVDALDISTTHVQETFYPHL